MGNPFIHITIAGIEDRSPLRLGQLDEVNADAIALKTNGVTGLNHWEWEGPNIEVTACFVLRVDDRIFTGRCPTLCCKSVHIINTPRDLMRLHVGRVVTVQGWNKVLRRTGPLKELTHAKGYVFLVR